MEPRLNSGCYTAEIFIEHHCNMAPLQRYRILKHSSNIISVHWTDLPILADDWYQNLAFPLAEEV